MQGLRFDLEALSAAVEQELAGLGVAQPDGRVTTAPDARAVRYYQSLGLVDRPAVHGRRALYGERQLRQLVAIKLLQSRGLALAEIQRRLFGLSPAELEQLIAAAAPPAPAVATSAAVSWRELLLAPGVRLAVEAGAEAGLDPDELAERARAALAALVRGTEATSGGRGE